MKTELLIVDIQNDFYPGGALGVQNGDKIIPTINKLMEKFDLVISSQDWHPKDSVHFKKWPIHCVAGTTGAEFHPNLNSKKINLKLKKGTDNKDDCYSAFEATNISFAEYLKKKRITTLYICGLTTDYCVKQSALDAVKNKTNTYVITDTIAAVNAQPIDGSEALKQMHSKGCLLIKSDEIYLI